MDADAKARIIRRHLFRAVMVLPYQGITTNAGIADTGPLQPLLDRVGEPDRGPITAAARALLAAD